MEKRWTKPAATLAACAFVWGAPKLALACGCVAPPTVGEPVVQAGERIVFAHEDGKVVAHIQLQYEGQASEFAWLLPLPSVPELELSSEELFSRLEQATAPRFVLTRQAGDGCPGPGGGVSFGCGDDLFLSAGQADGSGNENNNIAVKASSAGPYDYAVLRADDKEPMLEWLQENGYFVPATTESQLDPYVRPGAYFLALKLRAGQTAGDLQPVRVEYESERPMVPIILTAVAANPDMGILIWVLGEHRAVPVNYQHVVINEQYIDWPGGAVNYADVVSKAIDEAEGHHAFVTEHSSSTESFVGVLDTPGRFGRRENLARIERASDWVSALRINGFWWPSLLPIFQRAFPKPAAAQNIDQDEFYTNLDSYLNRWEPEEFDAVALTEEVWTRVVEPTLAAGKMFRDNRMMTRMFTVLSPEEMTKDPVFDFNPDLPPVSNVHQATMIDHCEGDMRAELTLDDGRVFLFTDAAAVADRIATEFQVPTAMRVEQLRLEGAPQVVLDNSAMLASDDDVAGGCIGARRARPGRFAPIMFVGLLLGMRMLRRRLRSPAS